MREHQIELLRKFSEILKGKYLCHSILKWIVEPVATGCFWCQEYKWIQKLIRQANEGKVHQGLLNMVDWLQTGFSSGGPWNRGSQKLQEHKQGKHHPVHTLLLYSFPEYLLLTTIKGEPIVWFSTAAHLLGGGAVLWGLFRWNLLPGVKNLFKRQPWQNTACWPKCF